MFSNTSYLVPRQEYHRLVDPSAFWSVLCASRRVDALAHYTLEMWGMLTEITREWFGFYVPRHVKAEWGPPIEPPAGVRVELCLDRHAAHILQNNVRSKYHPVSDATDRLSIFGGYAVRIPDGYAREQEGMAFLSRQADHIPDLEHYVIALSAA